MLCSYVRKRELVDVHTRVPLARRPVAGLGSRGEGALLRQLLRGGGKHPLCLDDFHALLRREHVHSDDPCPSQQDGQRLAAAPGETVRRGEAAQVDTSAEGRALAGRWVGRVGAVVVMMRTRVVTLTAQVVCSVVSVRLALDEDVIGPCCM